MAAWIDGNGCVPLDNLMEDAATAEIARAQLWQWVHHATGILDQGQNVSVELFKSCLQEELGRIEGAAGTTSSDAGRYRDAAGYLEQLTLADELAPFLTVILYETLA